MPTFDPIRFSQPLKRALIARQSRDMGHIFESGSEEVEDPEVVEAEKLAKQEKALKGAYQKGLKEGRAQAAEEAKKQLAEVKKEVETVLQALDAERPALSAELEELLPELIIEGVGRVLYSLEPDGETIQKVVLEILEGFDTEDSQLRLVLHPKDLEALKAVGTDIEDSYPGLRFVANESLHRGECYLEGRFGLADARYSAKLSSLRKVLE